jgi:hypothetical protein
MFLERLLTLLTGAFVSLCLGLGLVMMAMGAKEKAEQAEMAEVAAVKEAPRAAEQPRPAEPRPAESRPADQRPAEPRPAEKRAAEQRPAEPQAPEPRAPTEEELVAARNQIDAAIAAVPEYAKFFKRLADAFPVEYDKALDGFTANLARSKQAESVDFYVSDTVRRLRQSRGLLAAKAEAAPLARVFDMQLAVLRAIAKEDMKLCVGFLYGGASADFQKFAATRRPLVADMALAGIEAIASGQGKKIERTPPTDADFRQLEAALLAKGLGMVEIDALLDGKMPDPPLADAQMCAAGQTYLEVLHGLPEAVRLRIYGLAVELMARS